MGRPRSTKVRSHVIHGLNHGSGATLRKRSPGSRLKFLVALDSSTARGWVARAFYRERCRKQTNTIDGGEVVNAGWRAQRRANLRQSAQGLYRAVAPLHGSLGSSRFAAWSLCSVSVHHDTAWFRPQEQSGCPSDGRATAHSGTSIARRLAQSTTTRPCSTSHTSRLVASRLPNVSAMHQAYADSLVRRPRATRRSE
jgi:hypothetical protein